jgi:hypothetical protein
MCISFIQKIWSIPEILDQVYFIPTEILEHVYVIHTEILGRSRKSGPCVFHSYKIVGRFQKFWSMYFIYTENLERFRNSGSTVIHSIRQSGDVPENLEYRSFEKFWNSFFVSNRNLYHSRKIWNHRGCP